MHRSRRRPTCVPGHRSLIPETGCVDVAISANGYRAANSALLAALLMDLSMNPVAGPVALIGRGGVAVRPGAWSQLQAAREIGERDPNTILDVHVDGDLVVPAAQVLHERVANGDGAQ
jgi:hypothetical protein